MSQISSKLFSKLLICPLMLNLMQNSLLALKLHLIDSTANHTSLTSLYLSNKHFSAWQLFFFVIAFKFIFLSFYNLHPWIRRFLQPHNILCPDTERKCSFFIHRLKYSVKSWWFFSCNSQTNVKNKVLFYYKKEKNVQWKIRCIRSSIATTQLYNTANDNTSTLHCRKKERNVP